MKRRLLLVAFALLTVAASFAYNVGDYACNATQRYKITGDNLVQNGNFANGRDGWYGVDKETSPSADVWDILEGAGPNGETVLASLGATADQPFCNSWQLPGGTYAVSFMVKGTGATNLLPATVDTSKGTITFPANYADFFINADGAFTRVLPTDESPVLGVATTTYITEEWKQVNFFCTIEEGQSLVMHLEKIAEGIQFTNFEVHQAEQVYDVRIIQRRIAFARDLMQNPAFDVEAAQEAKDNLNGIIATIEESIAANALDDASEAETNLQGLNEEGIEPFLSVSSQNLKLNKYFNYVEDLTAFPKYNRGSIKHEQVIGGFKFRGDNWLHGQGAAEIAKQIQTSFANPAGSVSLFNETLPAGKYFISGEVRNAYCDKNYNLTYNLERQLKMYVGTDSVDCGVITGEEWVRYNFIGELKSGELFDAGFWWEGLDTKEGARFEVRNFEVRAIGEDVEAQAEHIKAWNTFKTQWDAATSRRNQLIEMIGNKEYPWEQDSLKNSQAAWDPYYIDIVDKGWVTYEGEDAGVATTDELNDWAEHQGYLLADTTETSTDAEKAWYKTYSKYAVVRGYDYAIKYVIAANQPISDLAAAINAAIASRDDDMHINGDKATFQKVIDAAQAALDDIKANTTDARREADEATIAAQIEALATAKQAFEDSAVLDPIIDIDFSNPAEAGEEVAYIIKGAAGQMELNTFEADNAVSGSTMFQLGVGEELTDVLRIGNGSATVNLADSDIPGSDDVIRVQFDLWVGGLIGKNVYVDLQNAAGTRVAGFSYGLYDGVAYYNDFDDDAHTGLDIVACGKGTSKNENAVLHGDQFKFSFDLIVDYKAQTLQGMLPVAPVQSLVGAPVAMPLVDDNVITKVIVGSNYNNSNRRCWFDNLKVFKYKSQSAGPVDVAVKEVKTIEAPAAVYTLSGVRVANASKPGLYIQNGKKFVVK